MPQNTTKANADGFFVLDERVENVWDVPDATKEVVVTPELASASDDARRALLDAGFTRAQLLEAIAVIAFTIANFAHNVAECAVDPKFEPQSWSVPAHATATA